jgi:hypothetical protein
MHWVSSLDEGRENAGWVLESLESLESLGRSGGLEVCLSSPQSHTRARPWLDQVRMRMRMRMRADIYLLFILTWL